MILSKDHRLARAAKVSLKDLLREPYVMLDLPHGREYFSALFDTAVYRFMHVLNRIGTCAPSFA